MSLSISVIVPVYRENIRVVERLISSVLTQEHILEIIIVDADNSLTTLVESERVSVVRSCTPGRARQMNLGAEKSEGDILWFLHVDSVVCKHSSQEIVEAIRSGYSFGAFRFSTSDSGLKYRLMEYLVAVRVALFSLVYGDQGIFCKREVFSEVGGYPEVPIFEDVDLWASLRRSATGKVLSTKLMTSTRRYELAGYLRLSILHNLLLFMYSVGVSREKMCKLRQMLSGA